MNTGGGIYSNIHILPGKAEVCMIASRLSIESLYQSKCIKHVEN